MGEEELKQNEGSASGQVPETFSMPKTGYELPPSVTAPQPENIDTSNTEFLGPTEEEQQLLEQIDALAGHYIAEIPEAERSTPLRPDQEENAQSLAMQTFEHRNHLYSSLDRLGNLPPLIREAVSQRDAAGTAQLLRGFADDPFKFAGETDKLSTLAHSPLPPGVRGALISLATLAGKPAPADLFRSVAEQIEKGTSVDAAFEQARQAAQSEEVRRADAVRQLAASKFLERLYPATFARAKEGFAARQIQDAQADRASTAEEPAAERRIEAKPLSELRYFHVEDDFMMSDELQEALTAGGMREAVGSVATLEQAEEQLRALITSNNPPDVILLDRSFPEYDGGMALKRSSEQLLNFLDKLAAENEQTMQAVDRMKVVILSGEIPADELQQIQEKYPRVAGAAQKGEAVGDRLKAELVRSGIAKE